MIPVLFSCHVASAATAWCGTAMVRSGRSRRRGISTGRPKWRSTSSPKRIAIGTVFRASTAAVEQLQALSPDHRRAFAEGAHPLGYPFLTQITPSLNWEKRLMARGTVKWFSTRPKATDLFSRRRRALEFRAQCVSWWTILKQHCQPCSRAKTTRRDGERSTKPFRQEAGRSLFRIARQGRREEHRHPADLRSASRWRPHEKRPGRPAGRVRPMAGEPSAPSSSGGHRGRSKKIWSMSSTKFRNGRSRQRDEVRQTPT